MTTPNSTYDVLVVGCGLMGSALARALARKGHTVAAWNRTPEKARALADHGVTPIDDIDTAVRSTNLVVTCTATYDTTRSALDEVSTWADTTIVNVGTGTPDDADEMHRWVTARGADYLDGSILCYPEHIGTPDGLILVSGPAPTWDVNRSVLTALGHVTHVSSRIRGASILEVTMSGGFYIAALAAYVEAASYALEQGLTAGELTDVTQTVVDLLGSVTASTAADIEAKRYDTDQATIAVYSAGMGMCLDAMRRAGHRSRMIEASAELLSAAEAAGLGQQGFAAQATLCGSGR
ncbi:NAD(P)-binding domain-containing protein [Gordonia sp. TBRC 11910]|uniref:NAD(P)-binding domain-containing protein n=1 Tax=Gordonia asplenii TaxID=2725283 RepID=A0A848L3I6_9ACTN|nr:NAD(P)-binding domain-containing protein [Gordonia asplenii]